MSDAVAVIGAGLTGLVVARRLREARVPVTVFEKSRGLGGRLATRRTEHGDFDHGAPVIHCERAPLAFLEARGSCVRWAGLGYVGLPGMSGMVRPLARHIDIRTGVEIGALTDGTEGFTLRDKAGTDFGPFGRVVVAVPAAQALRLLDGMDGAGALAGVRAVPVWTLMTALSGRPDLGDMIRTAGPVALAVRNASKPGRTGETWVVHAASDWSRAQLEDRPEHVATALLSEFADLAQGRLPEPVYATAHRWRFGLTEAALGAPCLPLAGGRVLVGGDWALGVRAEHAWLSGQDMADRLLA